MLEIFILSFLILVITDFFLGLIYSFQITTLRPGVSARIFSAKILVCAVEKNDLRRAGKEFTGIKFSLRFLKNDKARRKSISRPEVFTEKNFLSGPGFRVEAFVVIP